MSTPGDLSGGLLDALEAFDKQTAPFGLYACEEFKAKDKPFPRLHQEWLLCLKPCLEQMGYRAGGWNNPRDGKFRFDLPDGRSALLTVVRTSKIKVRKFGSAYRIDTHEKYQERWQELRLDRELSDLWKPSAWAESRIARRVFLFLGFAREPAPFEKELAQLQNQLQWDAHEAHYQTRTWADRYDRHFSVRLSAWARSAPEAGPQ